MTEVETETIVHWGAKLPGAVIRIRAPYTEAEARADVARNPGSVLVTRTETTTIETTAWTEA